MTDPLGIAKLYFELSNKSDFEGIQKLLTDTTTYNSQNTGLYEGAENILAMQRLFHGKFSSLSWNINTVNRVDSNTVVFDYDFVGELPNAEITKSSGLEYVTVQNGKISHIEIRNKA